jgi:hypothetical protein
MLYKKVFVFLIIGTVLLINQQQYLQSHADASDANIIVTISNQQIGTIPQNFVGFSTEEGNICDLILQEQNHPEIDTYLKNLSPFILRIGGGSVNAGADQTTWDPAGPGCYGTGLGILNISEAIIKSVFTLAQNDGFQVFWTVNLKANDPTLFAQEAAYVAQVGQGNLAGIIIGSEPDLYGWDYNSQYLPAWENYYNAIQPNLQKNQTIVGPETAYGIRSATCNDPSSWLQMFLPEEGTNVNPASFHTYFSNANNATINYILDPANMERERTYLDCDVAAANAVHVPIFATEFNSSSQAVDGTTNVFADSLWGLDFLLNASEAGLAGADAYGYSYPGSPSDDEAFVQLSGGAIQAAPLYYPMFLFHNLAQGGTLVQTTLDPTIDFAAHAVVSPNGNLQIFLINKDQINNTTVQVTLPSGYTSGTGIWLQSASVNSNVVTLGGSSISPLGTWSPTTIQSVPVSNNSFTIFVPYASAIAITLP